MKKKRKKSGITITHPCATELPKQKTYRREGWLYIETPVETPDGTPDLINHPPHYTKGGIDTYDFIRAKEMTWPEGNVVKYITRSRHKGNRLEDLEKAKWYLEKLIEEAGKE